MMKSFKDYVAERKLKNEYMDDKGHVVDRPKVKLVADYDGPDDKAPPTDKSGNKPSPYRSANSADNPNKSEKGFADMGDKNLVYKPEDQKDTLKPLGSPYPNVKAESFIRSTKTMSPSQFMKYMTETCGCGTEVATDNLPMVTAHHAGRFHPHPTEAIRYVAALSEQNDKMLENLVHELKQVGAFNKLMNNMMEHPEAYEILASLFSEEAGEKRAKSFARAIHAVAEAVGPPMGLTGDQEESKERRKGFHHPDDEDEDMPNGEEGDEDEDGLDDDMPPEDEETPDDGSEEGMPPEGEEGGDDSVLASDDMPMPPKKKKLPHDNLMGAMSGFAPLRKAMQGY